MRILMTGGTGFIGRHLRRRLVREGHTLVDIVRWPNGIDRLERLPGCEVIEADLFALAEDLGNIGSGYDVIIHLAQANVQMPADAYRLWRINVDSTLWLLEQARTNNVPRFFFASTGSVYDAKLATQPLLEGAPLAATSHYAASKIAAERLVSLYTDLFAVAWRFFGPYGPEQEERLVPKLIRRIQAGEPVALNRNGSPRMNYVYIDDVIEAIVGSLSIPTDRGLGPLNIGGAEALSIREVATIIGEILDRPVSFAETDKKAPDFVGDIDWAWQQFGWRPKVSFRDGIAATIRSMEALPTR